VYVCIKLGSLKSIKNLSPSVPARLREKGAKKSLGQAKNLLLAVVEAVAFLRNRLSCTLFSILSSACLINNERLLTKVVSSFSV